MYFFLDLIIFLDLKKIKKISKSAFLFCFRGIFQNSQNLKIPLDWQPCGNLASNIPSVSAFIDPYPHMKFQMDICSGSKVTEGDGWTDRPTDRRQTDRQTGRQHGS